VVPNREKFIPKGVMWKDVQFAEDKDCNVTAKIMITTLQDGLAFGQEQQKLLFWE
jgi:hypothetical protein